MAVPPLDRQRQADRLQSDLDSLKSEFQQARNLQEQAGLEDGFGLQIEFESFPEVELAFEQLANVRAGIELLNVRHEKDVTCATVFVPDGRLKHFEKMIADYFNAKTDKNGRPRDHQKLVDAIRAIRKATLRALWTDDEDVFPKDPAALTWWEVWLPVRANRGKTIETFRTLAAAMEMSVSVGELHFPERTVVRVLASTEHLARSMMTLNSIAELRAAKRFDDIIEALRPEEEPAWIDDLLGRTSFAPPSDDAVHVCVLDTGVNSAHPLLSPAVAASDLHTVEPTSGVHDNEGHGTAMAGLTLFGDLRAPLLAGEPVSVGHRLESVKLLEGNGANGNDAETHGYLTIQAVSRPEISAPHRHRLFTMAVTAKDNRDRGRPSAWSATLDRLAADVDGDGERPRIFLVSAGNILDTAAWAQTPESNSSDGIHDPGQSWNVLTVGAYTEMTDIPSDMDGFLPAAATGGLSPFSTTSMTWDSHWPLKPDVLFEGGNAVKDSLGAVWTQAMSLVTTHHALVERHLTTANATSAATALAGRMAAQLMTAYSELWVETIRALMVHSATWTDAMRRSFLPTDRNATKGDYLRLVRHCGYGVPDLSVALWSIGNSLTLVVQDQIQPFRGTKGEPKMNEMHLHRLPWPEVELASLGEIEVEMRVTLSYFVEPNPSARGRRSKHRYHSHGLRFEVRRPAESDDAFRKRINLAARDEEEGTPLRTDDSGWLIGSQGRTKGSIHSDIWRGTAVELARRGVLAVFPTGGWWKTRKTLGRFDRAVRYSLLVSIRAPDVDVDLVTSVENQVANTVEIESGG